MVGNGAYFLGAGGWHPGKSPDVPWTPSPAGDASDCSRFAICWCHEIVGHRPGFNVGSWATVSDDINSNSALEDALHSRELFELVTSKPEPGDLLVYKTFHIPGHLYIGHAAIIVNVPPVWTVADYSALTIVQVRGPNGKRPACIQSNGEVFEWHDRTWNADHSHPDRASAIIRVR